MCLPRLFIVLVVAVIIDAKPTSLSPAGHNLSDSNKRPAEKNTHGTVGSRGTDGTWDAAARLPPSSETGGNAHSRTKTDVTNGRTADYFSSSRQRNNRRLHKIEDVPDLNLDLNDDLTHDMGTEDESPLVQSLTAMASSLTAEQSAENSSEKDVILSDNSQSDQDTEPSDVEQELEHSSDEDEPVVPIVVGTDEEVHPQMQSPTSESKTLSTSNFVSTWISDSHNPNNNSPGRFSTTPKGLTTWSAVNGGNAHLIDQSGENTGFKGSAQAVPSDFTVSGMFAFNQQNPAQVGSGGSSTAKPGITSAIVTRENPSADFSTTEIPRTTKSNAVLSVRKKPLPLQINRLKHKKPNPSKYVRPQPENLIATEIGSDDTHTTFQLKPVQETKSTSSEQPTRYTRRPGYPWPINPPIITTPRTTMAQKKQAFQKLANSPTRRPNPYLKRTELPKLSLTTPTTTPAPASTTTYFRTPGVPLVNAFPLTLSNMSFMDFIRSQILPRIGLSLMSFMATSPLILTLLGASAAGGRRKRDTVSPTQDYSSLDSLDLSKILEGTEDYDIGSKSVKKHGAHYDTNEQFPAKDLSSLTSALSKLLKSSTKTSIVKKTKNTNKNKYKKET